MILLSEDGKGFVIIKSWDDVTERSGYKKQIDPKEIKLKQIIGRYHISPRQPCGISSCGTKHNKGYLILCEGGIETNIGNKCGKRIFGVDFQDLERIFTKDTNAQRYRQNISTFKNRLPGYKSELVQITNGQKQGLWCYKQMHWHMSKGFEEATLTALNQKSKRGDNVIQRERALSHREIEIAREAGNKSTHDIDIVRRINGLSAVHNYKKLKTLLNYIFIEDYETFLTLNEDEMDHRALKRWNRWVNMFENRITKTKFIIEECNRFLLPDNIQGIRSYKHLL